MLKTLLAVRAREGCAHSPCRMHSPEKGRHERAHEALLEQYIGCCPPTSLMRDSQAWAESSRHPGQRSPMLGWSWMKQVTRRLVRSTSLRVHCVTHQETAGLLSARTELAVALA